MQKLIFLFAITAMCCFSACFIDIDDDNVTIGCVDGDGPFISTDLDVAPFDELIVRLPVTVRLRQGDEQSVSVDGKPNIIDEIELDVDNGVWEIEAPICLRDLGPMVFFVTVKDLRRIKITNSGDVVSDELIIVDDIDLEVTGSGNLDMAIDADDIECRVTGSGDVFIEGSGDFMDLRVSGSGDFRGFDMEVSRCNARVSGSGDAEVRVNDLLTGKVSGSGDLRFKGNPDVDVDISGSGDVIDAN